MDMPYMVVAHRVYANGVGIAYAIFDKLSQARRYQLKHGLRATTYIEDCRTGLPV